MQSAVRLGWKSWRDAMSVWRFPGPVECEKRCASGPRQTGGSPGNKRGPDTWTHVGERPAAASYLGHLEASKALASLPLCASRTSAVARARLICICASQPDGVPASQSGSSWRPEVGASATAHVATGCCPHRSGSCLPASGALACTDRTAASLVAFALQELVCPTASGLALLGVARILFNAARPLPILPPSSQPLR